MVAKDELKNRSGFVNFIFAHAKVLSPQKLPIHFLQLQVVSLVMSVTNLRAALARLPRSPSCGVFLYLMFGSTGCGGNAGVFEEGISKLVHRAGEGIFSGNGFHRVSLCLSVSRRFPLCLCYLTVFPCLSVGRV